MPEISEMKNSLEKIKQANLLSIAEVGIYSSSSIMSWTDGTIILKELF
ncbi:MAG: hypothetical protein R6W68_00235 [Ignavibacteriaceae bacterium]